MKVVLTVSKSPVLRILKVTIKQCRGESTDDGADPILEMKNEDGLMEADKINLQPSDRAKIPQ